MKHKRTSTKSFRPEARVVRAGDSFQNFQARLGYGTGNVADGGRSAIRYLSRNRQEWDALYRGSWLSGKAVDCVAEDRTKPGIDITSEADPGDLAELMATWKRLGVWDKRAMR